jgi:hypothetical protein
MNKIITKDLQQAIKLIQNAQNILKPESPKNRKKLLKKDSPIYDDAAIILEDAEELINHIRGFCERIRDYA